MIFVHGLILVLLCREPTSSLYWPLSCKTNRNGRNQTCSILSTFLTPTENLWRKMLSYLFQQVPSLFHVLLLQVQILDKNYLYQWFFVTEAWLPPCLFHETISQSIVHRFLITSDKREYSQMSASSSSLWMLLVSQLAFNDYKQEFVVPS